MSPDVAGLCVDHEDGFEALAEGVQLWSVTHPEKKKTFYFSVLKPNSNSLHQVAYWYNLG
jgi:hypothetical protein